MMDNLYFDSAATTQMHPEVIELMYQSMKDFYGNPSSIHAHGRKAKSIIEESRKSIANIIGAKTNEILFTSSASESNNIAIQTAIHNLGVKRIISSRIEHKSVLDSCSIYSDRFGVELILVSTNEKGEIDYKELELLLSESTEPTLVSLMHANNEIGILLDVDIVSSLCKKYHSYLHVDMVQTIGHLQVDLSKLEIHFASSSAHKYHGPKGVGFLYSRNGIPLFKTTLGGGQERGFRAGTENTISIIGMSKALELSHNTLEKDIEHVSKLRELLYNSFESLGIGISFNTYLHNSLYTIISVNIPLSEKEIGLFLFKLDMSGISCSGGSACSSGASTGSYVIDNLNVSRETITIRFSFSKFNTKEEVLELVERIKSLI